MLAAALIDPARRWAGERKNNLSLNRNDDDKYLRYKDEMTSVVLESFPRCLVRVNQVGCVVCREGERGTCRQEQTTPEARCGGELAWRSVCVG